MDLVDTEDLLPEEKEPTLDAGYVEVQVLRAGFLEMLGLAIGCIIGSC